MGTFGLDALPGWAAEIVRAVVAACKRDERIVGLTLNGSGATGTLDEFSDLDFVLVCRDGAEDELIAEAPAFAASLGPLLASFTGEHVGEPGLLICLFGPPLRHVDLKFVLLTRFASRVEDGVVLFERDGVVTDAIAASPPVWPPPDLQWIEDRFWIWVHYAATKIGRGELFECADGLAFLRQVVFGPLLAVVHGRRAQGMRRVEAFAPDALPALERTVPAPEASSCVAALRASVSLYRELREVTGSDVVRRDAAEAASVPYLDGIAARIARTGGENRATKP